MALPVKASDWEHTVKRVFIQESGGSGFFSGIEGADAYAEAGKEKGDIKGIETDDQSGKVTINLTEPDGTLPQRAGHELRRHRPRRHARSRS